MSRRAFIVLSVALSSALAMPPAVHAVAPVADVQAQAVTPAANPIIQETCGLDATLILDASGSIQNAGAVQTVRNAADDLIDALKDTNSTLRVTHFGTFSQQLSPRVAVNAATTGPGGALATAVSKYYTPSPPRPSGVNIYNGSQIRNSELTWTNWQDAFEDVDRPELAIYMTDGDPTAYNVNATRTNVNVSSTGVALDNAITAANALKNGGTRVLVVGVGSGLTSSSSQDRLTKISGPQLEKSPAALAGKTINQVDAVAFSDFEALGRFLRSVVTSLCGNSVTVQKLSQTAAGADYVPATGWDITVQPTVTGGFSWVEPTGPDNSAQTRATSGAQATAAFQWKPKTPNQKATVRVSETVKNQFTANRYTCDVKSDSGTRTVNGAITNQNPSFEFDMNPSEVAACKLYNDFNYAPGIAITKTAKDDPVRGNGSGWNEEYTFQVSNTGNAPLTVTKPVDPQCSTITGPFLPGGGAATGKLQPGDSWDYTCAATIGPLATVTTPLTRDNTVAVTGIAPNSATVTAQAQESVDVKTPRIAIDKKAKRTGGGPIDDGGLVVAGTRVTYVYEVRNTGNDVLTLTRATAVTDDKCGPVTYVSGDTGADQRLGLGETWIYECTKTINPPSSVTSVTNVATVTSQWSNPQNRQQNNGAVTDSDSFTINVDRGANLRIVKVTNPGDVNQDFDFTVMGQGVPASDAAFSLNTSTDPQTPPASRNIALDGPDGGGSQYTITEAGSNGWDLTGLTCDKTPDSASGGVLKVTIRPREDVTCTFTNQRRPEVTLTKQTSPAGANTPFGFTAARPNPLPAPDPATVSLADGESQTWTALPPGAFTLTESTLPAGWTLDDIVCSGTTDSADVGQRTVELTLAYGEQADCVFTNSELPPATLTVIKDEVPATIDPEFGFTASGIGLVTPGVQGSEDFDLQLGGSKNFTVRPSAGGNVYTVTETEIPTPPPGESGFDLREVACYETADPADRVIGDVGSGAVQVTIEPGEQWVCEYRNEQRPRLTIVKSAVNPADPSDATDFTFTQTGLAGSPSFTLADGQAEVFANVTSGAFAVTEAAPPTDWILTSLTCTGTGSGSVSIDVGSRQLSSGGLAYGDDVVCTYVNTKEPAAAYLVVRKQTDPVGDPAEFDFTVSGGELAPPVEFGLAGGEENRLELNPPFDGEDYTIDEAEKSGWKLTDIDCQTSSDPGAGLGQEAGRSVTVNVLPGEVVVCTFSNQKYATLTVDKVTDVTSAKQFEFTATGVTPTSFTLTGGGTPRQFTGIPAATAITLTETVPTSAPDRWKLADISCDGTANPNYTLAEGKVAFTIGAGEDVRCTYTDVQVPKATVQIVKAADPADGTAFDFTATGADGGVRPADRAFSLAPDGDIAVKTLELSPKAGGEDFTFTEGPLPADWNFVDVECVNDGAAGGAKSAPDRRIVVTIKPGDSLTCTFSNVKDASLTVVKEASDDPQQQFLFDWSAAAPDRFTLQDQQSRTAGGLAADDYTVAEVDLPADWFLDGPNGEHPTCVGAAGVQYDVPLGATVTLAPGDEAVCTFADFFEYDPKIELEKVPNRTVALEGQPVVYTYTVTNSGNVAVEPVGALDDVVVDDKCANVTVVTGAIPLPPGEFWTFSCTVDAITTGNATNRATATVADPTDPGKTLESRDQATVEVRVPGLKLVKSADKPTVYPDTQVTYTYELRNTGETKFEGPPSKDAWVTDDKCAPVTYSSGDAGTAGVLDVGETWTYTCGPAVITQSTTNTGTGKATPFVDEGGPKQTGPQMTVTDTADVEVIRKGIAITKAASAPGGVEKDGRLLVPTGTEVTFTYEVTSGTATVPMRPLDVEDTDCAPVTYRSGDTNDNGLVDPGETWVYTCAQDFDSPTTVTNTVVITAVEPQLGGLSEADAQATVESFRGSIAVKKSASAKVVATGTPVTYTYEALNDGTVDLTDVSVTDDRCAPLVYLSGDNGDSVMQPGEVWTYQCTSTLDSDVTNIATATGTTPPGGKVSDSSSVTVFVVGGSLKPAIEVTKTPSRSVVKEGGRVTYTYQVRNAGNMPLADIRVTDDKCSPVVYRSGDDNGDGLLTGAGVVDLPDETWTYTCTTLLRRDTTNTVTATGSPWAGQVVGPDVSATARATVRVRRELPIDVEAVKKCKGTTCTLVEKSRTNRKGTLTHRVVCRPVGSAAAGEVRYCRTKVTKKGAVMVKVLGYRKVRVTVFITAKPKPKYKDSWRANSWKRSWVIRL